MRREEPLIVSLSAAFRNFAADAKVDLTHRYEDAGKAFVVF